MVPPCIVYQTSYLKHIPADRRGRRWRGLRSGREGLEIKDYTDDGLDTLLQIIDKNGFTESCSVISFDRTVLDKVRERNDKVKLYALVSKLNKDNLKKCLDDPTIGVSFNGHKKINNENKIKQLQDAGVALACWTVDDKETMQKYYKMGITTFVTNRIYKK